MKNYALLRRTVLSCLAIAGLGCVRAGSAPAPADQPRPVILFVHGRGQAARDSSVARASWLRALREGSRVASGDPLLADADVRNVWYADVLDPRSDEGCEPAAPGQRGRVSEAGISEGLGAFGRGLLGALLDLAPDTTASPLQALAGDIMYLSDGGKRCAAERRVLRAVDRAAAEGRRVIVVAHSMGGLVAYRALHAPTTDATGRANGAGPSRIDMFVTLGTPLTVPLVREITLGSGAITRPARVVSWVNVRDPDDPFASSIVSEGAAVTEVSLSASGDAERAHDALRYLRDGRTARAILTAWCEGFTVATQAPAACATMRQRASR